MSIVLLGVLGAKCILLSNKGVKIRLFQLIAAFAAEVKELIIGHHPDNIEVINGRRA